MQTDRCSTPECLYQLSSPLQLRVLYDIAPQSPEQQAHGSYRDAAITQEMTSCPPLPTINLSPRVTALESPAPPRPTNGQAARPFPFISSRTSRRVTSRLSMSRATSSGGPKRLCLLEAAGCPTQKLFAAAARIWEGQGQLMPTVQTGSVTAER